MSWSLLYELVGDTWSTLIPTGYPMVGLATVGAEGLASFGLSVEAPDGVDRRLVLDPRGALHTDPRCGRGVEVPWSSVLDHELHMCAFAGSAEDPAVFADASQVAWLSLGSVLHPLPEPDDVERSSVHFDACRWYQARHWARTLLPQVGPRPLQVVEAHLRAFATDSRVGPALCEMIVGLSANALAVAPLGAEDEDSMRLLGLLRHRECIVAGVCACKNPEETDQGQVPHLMVGPRSKGLQVQGTADQRFQHLTLIPCGTAVGELSLGMAASVAYAQVGSDLWVVPRDVARAADDEGLFTDAGPIDERGLDLVMNGDDDAVLALAREMAWAGHRSGRALSLARAVLKEHGGRPREHLSAGHLGAGS